MTKQKNTIEQDVVLCINMVSKALLESIKRYNKSHTTNLKAVVLVDTKFKKHQEVLKANGISSEHIIVCDFNKSLHLSQALLVYQERLFAVVSHSEVNQPYFQKVIPHVPYVRTPTVESLTWATDKLAMRQRFRIFDKKITPKFLVVKDVQATTLKTIKEKIGFPLVIKPTSLASSLLVSICFHEEDLEKNLRKSMRHIRAIYKENKRKETPKILVEEFMEGTMYSVDAYVSSRGRIYFCPPVSIKTGREAGYEDFFGYLQMTPTTLPTEALRAMEETAKAGIHALGLRSVTAHVELIRCEKGWKILEIGARVGGFRHLLYTLSYGIDHAMNDVLIRAAKKPIIPKKKKGYAATMKWYAKKEGVLTKLQGIMKIQNLKSFYRIDINKQLGDTCKFAKHGGKSVFHLFLFNTERSALLADIRRVEQLVHIQTTRK